MSERLKEHWWKVPGSAAGIFMVSVFAGILFVANAQLFADQDPAPTSVRELAAEEMKRLEVLESEVGELRAERDALVTASDIQIVVPDPDVVMAASATPLAGPGVRIRMWDAPTPPAASPFDANDLVVHQQDLEAVINALWAGGAEGVAVQGERLTTTSGIRCVGNVLLLHGRQYSPPYVIEAIGDPEELSQAISASSAITTYLDYVAIAGLGWEMVELRELRLEAYAGTGTLLYAQPIEETNG